MNDTETPYFELKDTGDFIRINLVKLSYPEAALHWDRNFIKSNVTVKAGSFKGEFSCELMTTDFQALKEGLAALYDKLNGYATFETLESQIELKIKGDGLGHFTTECEVMDKAGIGNKLQFELSFDQTQITELIRQLEYISTVFPATEELKK